MEKLSKRGMGKGISEKKNTAAIIKTETWAKASQKVKQNHRHHFDEGHPHKKNTTMNMKKSIEANTKLNMNMDVKMKMQMQITIKMNMKITMNVKRNMNMNMKINMNENLNEYEFGHECHDAREEECGFLTRR
jgi:hypothetical protein